MPKTFKLPVIFVHLPFLWVGGLTLFPCIFFKQNNPSLRLINHEQIHIRQQVEMGLILFYVWYLVEFLMRWIQYGHRYTAYRNISFEREAYANDNNLKYLATRKLWGFWRYMWQK
ncbi:MAG: hypothetical protein R2822_25110 [Spirosomataceae bacterium]